MKALSILAFVALAGCNPSPQSVETVAATTVDVACALTRADLPERFRTSTVDVAAQAVRIMCRAWEMRQGRVSATTFADLSGDLGQDCEDTQGFAYAAGGDPFARDWFAACLPGAE